MAAPIVLALIAVVLFATALSLRARFKAQRERRSDAKGVDPMMAARAVVFGHASALVAALVSGVYGGTGVLLLELLDIPARRDQAIYAGFSRPGRHRRHSGRLLPGARLQTPGGRRHERWHGPSDVTGRSLVVEGRGELRDRPQRTRTHREASPRSEPISEPLSEP